MQEIISRKEAKKRGLKKYFTGEICCRGHISERVTVSANCVECLIVYKTEHETEIKERMKKYRIENRGRSHNYYLENKDRILKKGHDWYINNIEHAKEIGRSNYLENMERKKNYQRNYSAINRDRVLQNKRDYYHKNKGETVEKLRLYRKENRHLANAARARRRSAKIKATPSWDDHAAINMVYKLARDTTIRTGIVHHVDHIVPLQGKTVCGLHVEYNLRVITGSENSSKQNRYWPDM